MYDIPIRLSVMNHWLKPNGFLCLLGLERTCPFIWDHRFDCCLWLEQRQTRRTRVWHGTMLEVVPNFCVQHSALFALSPCLGEPWWAPAWIYPPGRQMGEHSRNQCLCLPKKGLSSSTKTPEQCYYFQLWLTWVPRNLASLVSQSPLVQSRHDCL